MQDQNQRKHIILIKEYTDLKDSVLVIDFCTGKDKI
jgi:hypothetical protein